MKLSRTAIFIHNSFIDGENDYENYIDRMLADPFVLAIKLGQVTNSAAHTHVLQTPEQTDPSQCFSEDMWYE